MPRASDLGGLVLEWWIHWERVLFFTLRIGVMDAHNVQVSLLLLNIILVGHGLIWLLNGTIIAIRSNQRIIRQTVVKRFGGVVH